MPRFGLARSLQTLRLGDMRTIPDGAASKVRVSFWVRILVRLGFDSNKYLLCSTKYVVINKDSNNKDKTNLSAEVNYLTSSEYLTYAVEGIEPFSERCIEIIGKGHRTHGGALIFGSHLVMICDHICQDHCYQHDHTPEIQR